MHNSTTLCVWTRGWTFTFIREIYLNKTKIWLKGFYFSILKNKIVVLSVYIHLIIAPNNKEKIIIPLNICMHISHIPLWFNKVEFQNKMDDITFCSFAIAQFCILYVYLSLFIVFHHPNIRIMELTKINNERFICQI